MNRLYNVTQQIAFVKGSKSTEGVINVIFLPKRKNSSIQFQWLKHGWTVLHSVAWFLGSPCLAQKIFLPCFLCFKLCIFCRGDSWKSVSYSRLNESLKDTGYCQKAVPKSGFLWSCSWTVFAAYDRYYQRLDIGIKWKQHRLLLSNSFGCEKLLFVSSRQCISSECYFYRIW